MDSYQATISRRSIRRCKDIPVPYEVLENCVNAARLAPTGKNRQFCEFIIVDDESLLPRVFDNITLGGESHPEQMPRAYIITLINSRLEKEFIDSRSETDPGGNLISTLCGAGMAVENIVLVALEQGLGACPILMFTEGELKQLLNIPDKYDVAMVVLLGYPDESPVPEVSSGSVETWIDSQGVRHVPKRKLEDITHHNKFP